MKEIEFKVNESKVKERGVKTYVYTDEKKSYVGNIEIDDDVETLILGLNHDETIYDLMKVDKTFPNVKSLVIMPDVSDIKIKNKMFPNVRTVISYSPKYLTSKYLMKTMNHTFKAELVNSFCLNEYEELDLKGIISIQAFALDGCMANTISFNKKSYIIRKQAFEGSVYEKEPFVNGVKAYHGFMFDIDKNANEIVFDSGMNLNFIDGSDKFVEKLIIKNEDLLNAATFFSVLSNIKANHLCIGRKMSFGIRYLIEICEKVKAHFVDLLEPMVGYSSHDGILYTNKGKELRYIPKDRTEAAVIPEGVQVVRETSCVKTNISSIEFPKSLEVIQQNSFWCSNVSSVILKGKTKIKSLSFSKCHNLCHLVLPEIDNIAYKSFYDCPSLNSVAIPKSVKKIEPGNFKYASDYTIEGDKIPNGLFTSEKFSYIKCILDNDFISLNYKNNCLYIPFCVRYDKISSLKNLLEQGMVEGFFEFTEDNNVKLDTAIAEAIYTNSKKARNYIRRSGKQLLKRYFSREENQLEIKRETLLKLIENDLMTDMTLTILIRNISENKDIDLTLKAYALDKLENAKRRGFSL